MANLANAQAARHSLSSEAQSGVIGIHQTNDLPIISIGVFKFGEPFFVKKLNFGATGIVQGDIITSNGYFTPKEITIPNGTQVFAVKATVTISGATGGYAVGNGVHEIAKWCGNVEKPHRRLGGGTGFCISDKFKASDRTIGDNLLLESNPFIRTIGVSTPANYKSAIFPVDLGYGGEIKSDYQIIQTGVEFTSKLELRQTINIDNRGRLGLRTYGFDGEGEVLISQQLFSETEKLPMEVKINGIKYEIKKHSDNEFEVTIKAAG